MSSACLAARAAANKVPAHHAADHSMATHLAPVNETRSNGTPVLHNRAATTNTRGCHWCRGAELTLQDWAAADAAHPDPEDPSDLMDQPGEVTLTTPDLVYKFLPSS
jgi:hypothetical protein